MYFCEREVFTNKKTIRNALTNLASVKLLEEVSNKLDNEYTCTSIHFDGLGLPEMEITKGNDTSVLITKCKESRKHVDEKAIKTQCVSDGYLVEVQVYPFSDVTADDIVSSVETYDL